MELEIFDLTNLAAFSGFQELDLVNIDGDVHVSSGISELNLRNVNNSDISLTGNTHIVENNSSINEYASNGNYYHLGNGSYDVSNLFYEDKFYLYDVGNINLTINTDFDYAFAYLGAGTNSISVTGTGLLWVFAEDPTYLHSGQSITGAYDLSLRGDFDLTQVSLSANPEATSTGYCRRKHKYCTSFHIS